MANEAMLGYFLNVENVGKKIKFKKHYNKNERTKKNAWCKIVR